MKFFFVSFIYNARRMDDCRALWVCDLHCWFDGLKMVYSNEDWEHG